MTLRELLKMKELSDLKIINQNADLDRVVSTVESTETPDVAGYLPKNALLITTAMAYKEDQKELCRLVESLDQLPCAGMAVKIGRFIDELSQEVINRADALGFPLLQIPMYQTLGEVYHHVLACIWGNENEDILYALNVQKVFYDLILQRASMGKLVHTLGMILKQPVMIFSLFGELCDSSNTDKKEEKVMEMMYPDLLPEIKGLKYSQTFTMKGSQNRQLTIYPIQVASYNTHYLIVLEQEEKKMDEVLGFALGQILLIFGIHFYKSFYMSYNEILLRNHFFQNYIKNGQKDKKFVHQMVLEGKNLGLGISSYYKVVIAKLPEMEGKVFNSSRFMRREEYYIIIYDWLKHQLEGRKNACLIVLPDMEEWSYVIIIQENPYALEEEKLIKIHDWLKEVLDTKILFSFGNSVSDLNNLENSYWKAKSGFHNGEAGKETSYICYYKPQNILELMEDIATTQIKEVCIQMLRTLAYPQDEMALELRKTLKVYLENHCSIISTSNKLFLHRNTIRYRIKKCQEILENDLTDPDYCFQLQLGLLFTET
mgnify:CR=1 FL=1